MGSNENSPQNCPEVLRLFRDDDDEKLYYPHNPEVTNRLLETIDSWKRQGACIVFMAGCFDVFHKGHKGYLRNVRREAAALLYHEQWEALSDTQKQEAMCDPRIKLVVTVDDDAQIYYRKSFRQDKANTVRPVQPWIQRADNVASVTIPYPTTRLRYPVVDLVTTHNGYDPVLAHTIHRSDIDLGQAIAPDVWMICEESWPKTGTCALALGLPNTRIHMIPDENFAEINPHTARPFRTSDTLQRLIDAREDAHMDPPEEAVITI